MSQKERKAGVKREDGLMHSVILGLLGCRKGLSVQHLHLPSLGPCPVAQFQLTNCCCSAGGERPLVEAGLEQGLFSLWQTNTFLTHPSLPRAGRRGHGSGQAAPAHRQDKDSREGLNPQGQRDAGDKCLLLLGSGAKQQGRLRDALRWDQVLTQRAATMPGFRSW